MVGHGRPDAAAAEKPQLFGRAGGRLRETKGMTGTEIRRLDATTVERIAAGKAGGTERIRVADDGVGMTEADLRMAVREQTTSKIGNIADLEAGRTHHGVLWQRPDYRRVLG